MASPVNSSKGVLAPITLKWNKSSLAESYSLQVSTDSSFSSTIIDTSGITDTMFTLNNLNNLTQYFWRVKAVNVGGESDWSEIWSFKTLGEPTTVTLLQPKNEAVNQPLDLDLVWSKAVDQLGIIKGNSRNKIKPELNSGNSKFNPIKKVSNYWLEVTTNTDSVAFISDTTLTDTTYHLTGLSNSTDYWWRVKAKNEAGWGAFTNWSKFTTIIDTPAVVILQNPKDKSVGNVQPVTLIWHKAERAKGYTLQVSTNGMFKSTLIDSSGVEDTTFVLPKLNNKMTYYWRVKGKNIAGEGSWSEVWSFKTIGEPTTVTLIQPTPKANNQPVAIDFIWSKAYDQLKMLKIGVIASRSITKKNKFNVIKLGANKKGNGVKKIGAYWFELSKDTTKTSMLIDTTLTDTTKHVEGLEHLTKYYWRVKAKNEAGWGKFAGWSKFTTIVDVPGIVRLISPVDSLLYDSTMSQPEFIWHKDSLADYYKIQLSYQSDFSSLFFTKDSIPDTSFAPLIAFYKDFYWRARGSNIAGNGEWSSPNFVRVVVTGVKDEKGTVPKIYSLSYNYPNPFNPTTIIEYTVPKQSFVKIEVYDVVGNRILTLVNKFMNPGKYRINFSASQLSSGIYFYRMQAGKFNDVKKMILLK